MKKTALFSLLLALFVKPAFGGGFVEKDCPEGTTLLEVKIFYIANAKNPLAAVLVDSPYGPELPSYLPRRSDGWTYLSSERSRVHPGDTVSNCLPAGGYIIRVEYLKRVPLVEEWLVGRFQYGITLSEKAGAGGKPAFATWIEAGWADHIRMHCPLFTTYALLPILFLVTLIAVTKQLRKQP